MKCQLFYGRRNADPAGALQKSLLETLDRGSAKVYLILPEQATFRREVEIAANRGNHDLWNFEITSFRRLADRFLPGEVLDPLGRRLLIYDILSVAGESMKALKPQRITVGFVDDISDVMKEVSMNGISTEALFALAAVFAQRDTAGDLGDKLYDIALVQQAMEERGLTDENGRLFGLAEAIRKEKLFADTYFFFDEFFDFTAAEYQVIAALAEVGANLSFAFLSDRSDGVFAKTNDAISRIIAIAGEASLSLELTPVAGTEEDTALAFLERNYFLPQSPPVFCGACRRDYCCCSRKINGQRCAVLLGRSRICWLRAAAPGRSGYASAISAAMKNTSKISLPPMASAVMSMRRLLCCSIRCSATVWGFFVLQRKNGPSRHCSPC